MSEDYVGAAADQVAAGATQPFAHDSAHADRQARTAEISEIYTHQENRIAVEWEGQCPSELDPDVVGLQNEQAAVAAAAERRDRGGCLLYAGTRAGKAAERFTARSIERDKELLFERLVELRQNTAGQMIYHSSLEPRWFNGDGVNTTRLPEYNNIPGRLDNPTWSPPVSTGGIGELVSPSTVDVAATSRALGSAAAADDRGGMGSATRTSTIRMGDVLPDIRNITHRSLVYRQLIGLNGDPARDEEFNSLYGAAASSTPLTPEYDAYIAGSMSLGAIYERARQLLMQNTEATLAEFIRDQLNTKLTTEGDEIGRPFMEGDERLAGTVEQVTAYFRGARNINYESLQLNELQEALEFNYTWLYYAHILVNGWGIQEGLYAHQVYPDQLEALGYTAPTTFLNNELDDLGIKPSASTDAMFGNQSGAGARYFTDLESYLNDFLELVYRVKIHHAILEYDRRLARQVLESEGVTDVVNGEEYSGNVDRGGRFETIKNIIRDQQGGGTLSCEEDARLRRLAEQCFLTDSLPIMASLNQGRRVDYKTFTPLQGKTDTIVNKLVFDPGLVCLEDLTPAEISSLVPRIRIYKVFSDLTEEGPFVTHEQEVPFHNYIQPNEIEHMTSPGPERGRGAGIVSFDWAFENNDPFAARRVVQGKLKLFFQNMDVFLEGITLPVEGESTESHREFHYVDLINHSTTEGTAGLGWNPDYYQVKVEVGWTPSDLDVFTGDTDCKLRAINQSRLAMFVVVGEHELDINDQGNVDLTLEFTGYQEASYSDADADILATREVVAARLRRRMLLQAARENDPCDTEIAARIQQEYRGVIAQENYSSWQRLLKTMGRNEQLFYLKVPLEKLEEYYDAERGGSSFRGLWRRLFNMSPLPPDRAMEFELAGATQQEIARAQYTVTRNTGESVLDNLKDLVWNQDGDYVNIQYFFLGDLVETALGLISESPHSPPVGFRAPRGKLQKNLRLLLGPLTFKQIVGSESPREEYIYNINLADVPISMNFFIEWFLNDVIGENRRAYPALLFIQNILNTLVKPALTRQCQDLQNIPRQPLELRTNVFSTTMTGPSHTWDPISVLKNWPPEAAPPNRTRFDVDHAYETRYNSGGPLLHTPNPGEPAAHYMLLYLINSPLLSGARGNFYPVAASNGEPADPGDITRGIYHIGIGKNRGLLKTIKFSKTDFSLREARLERELLSEATGLAVMSNVYSVTLTMIGNKLFLPGSIIYIDPTGFGSTALGRPSDENSAARIIGIGGYHMVYTVESYIEDGKYETVLKARWESAGGIDATDDVPVEGGGRRCIRGVEARALPAPGGD